MSAEILPSLGQTNNNDTHPSSGLDQSVAGPAYSAPSNGVDHASHLHTATSATLDSAQAGPQQKSKAATIPEPPQSTPLPKPEFLQPSEFYPLSNHPNPVPPPAPLPGQYLSPENDKLATRGIPIFRPSLEEFTDFEAYVTRTVPWGQYSGIVKIIPPSEWTQALPPIPAASLAGVKIKSPIQQNMLGQAGLFRQTNVEKMKNRPLSIKDWFEKCNNPKWAGPGPKDMDVTLDRDSAAAKQKRAEEEVERKRKRLELKEKRQAAAARRQSRKAGESKVEESVNGDGEEEELEDNKHVEEGNDEGERLQENGTLVDNEHNDVPPLDPSTRHSPQSSPDPLAKTPDSSSSHDPTLEWYDRLDLFKAWLPKGTTPADYTPEACAHMERKFWKTLGLGEPGWYGADLQGTLFPDPETPWNVAHLPNLLNRLGRELPGVNRPYLYFGMWRAAFAWHVEDMDLFSINYIHFGAPKFWYAIPQGQAEQFERTITSYFPREATQCDQFLRHKAYVMSPTRLAKDGIHVNMLVHNQGEYVITFPRGYHAGWNMGFNCAESVNFALDSWVELGKRAKVCQCVNHSVRIDMDELLGDKEKAEQEAKMKTEQELVEAFQAEKSRKRTMNGGERPRKRMRPDPAIVQMEEESIHEEETLPIPLPPVAGLEKKRKAIPLDKKPRAPTIVKTPSTFPCIMCPHQSMEDLVPVHEPAEHIKAMCKSHDGIPRAHQICVNSVPEVWTEEIDVGGLQQVVVKNVSGIAKARWSLKCQSCNDKKLAGVGAKVQCVNGKCPRAFHVTCARDDEQVVYRLLEVDEPNTDEAGQPIVEKVLKTELLCPSHNPDVKEAKRLQAANELKNRVLSILPGQSVKVKLSRGSFEVKMVRVIEHEQKAEVQHENGQIAVIKWTEFDFRPAAVHKPVENEYAKEYVYSRNADGKAVPVAPTTASTTTETPRPAQPKAPRPKQSAPAQPRPKPKSQPLSVQQMLNHPSHPQHIPSQVVVCDSGYQYPQHAYGQPPGFPTYLPSNHYSGQSSQYPDQYASQYHSAPAAYGYAYPPAQQYYGEPGQSPYMASSSAPPTSYHPPIRYSVDSNYQPSVLQPYPQQYSTMPAPSAIQQSEIDHAGHPAASPNQYDQQLRQAWPSPAMRPAMHAAGAAPSTAPVPSLMNGAVDHGAMAPRRPSQPATSHPSLTSSQHGSNGFISQSNGTIGQTPIRVGERHSFSHNGQAVAAPSHPTNNGIQAKHNGSTGVGKIDLGLGRMEQLMRHLGPLKTPAIHLAGTNGKGSVSAMLESALRTAGLRVGRYNSPHLIEPRDAIALDGLPPHPVDYQAAMRHVQQISTSHNINATTFEIATAAAYDLINTYKADVMIIECGMGGVGDATNVIPPNFVLATALTSVGLDHTAFLGNTLEEITKVKAGIAVNGGLAIIGSQTYNSVARVARDVAQANGSRVVITDRAYVVEGKRQSLDLETATSLPRRRVRTALENGANVDADLGLAGEHQLDNASLAINILYSLRKDERATTIQPKLKQLSDDSIRRGIAATTWKGRCDLIRLSSGMPILVDGAHNADSAVMLRRYLESLIITPKKKVTWIIGLSESKGKSPESVLDQLLGAGERVIAVNFGPVEGMPWVKPVDTGVISRIGRELTKRSVIVKRDVKEALEEVQRWSMEERGLTVVAGSLYVVADVYRLLGSVHG